jgi:uncharacterized tellurite resistance protein B-like protein
MPLDSRHDDSAIAMEELLQPSQHLQDLSLLYIALALEADGELDDLEVSVITHRLRSWETGLAQEAMLVAVDRALTLLSAPQRGVHIDEATIALGRWSDALAKRRMLDDMVDIALADHRFLHGEARFIGKVAKVWEVRPSAQGEFWTVFRGVARRGGWSILHDLALVYITLAHQPDRELDHREVLAIIRKIGEWSSDLSPSDVEQVVRETLAAYGQEPEGSLFEASVNAVAMYMPAHQRSAVMNDLFYIAHADGRILPAERILIEQLADRWGLRSGEASGEEVITRIPVPE